MIPLTTDVRLKRGLPKTVIGIIVGTFLLHVIVQAGIDFKWLDPHFRSRYMAFHYDDPDPVDWLLSIFAHSSYWHWFGNMFYLWIFGSILEDRLGALKFFLLFLVCGLAANALEMGTYSLLLYVLNIPISDFRISTIGASGAISGIMGLSMFRFYKAKVLLVFKVPAAFYWVRRYIPIWVFCFVDLLGDFIGIFLGDNVAHLAHIGGFLGGLAAARFLGLKEQSAEEIHLDLGQEYREARMFKPAAEEFETALKIKPENALANENLGFCYWGLHLPNKVGDTYLERSRLRFEKALELYLKQEKYSEATLLYEKLMKWFSAKDFPEKIPVILRAHQARDGLSQAVLTDDPKERRRILEENFMSQAHRGVYQAAHLSLRDLLPMMEVSEMEPSFLEAAGEVCLRMKDQEGVETFFDQLSKKGDERQAVRALTVLSRYWLKTPKQLRLVQLYRAAEERLMYIKSSDEWVQLGGQLKG
jgi:membrane associated rhomboid family serine protease